MISIIIPVYHEENIIDKCINHLLTGIKDDDYEIIIVDGDYQQSSIKSIKKRIKNIKYLSTTRGRGNQMNIGASKAKGNILLFLHGDTQLPNKALQKINTAMSQGNYIGGAFNLAINSHKSLLQLIAFCASMRSQLTRIPFGDHGIFIKKDYFFQVGGYKEIPLMEDIELMRRIKQRKDKIIILKDKIKTSARRWEKNGILYNTLRNWILQLLYFLGTSPHKLVQYYYK